MTTGTRRRKWQSSSRTLPPGIDRRLCPTRHPFTARIAARFRLTKRAIQRGLAKAQARNGRTPRKSPAAGGGDIP